jgi:hypothetical protein
VLLNAYSLSAADSAHLRERVVRNNATLVVIHAAGIAPSPAGLFSANGTTALLDDTVQLGGRDSPMSLRTRFIQPPPGAPASTPDWTPLYSRNETYGDDMAGIVRVAPWWFCKASAADGCAAIGELADAQGAGQSGAAAGGDALPSACWCERRSHRTLFMALPGLPLKAWRGVAKAAGVHVWAGVSGTDVAATAHGAFVDAMAVRPNVSLLTVRIGPPAPGTSPPGDVHCLISLPRMAARVSRLAGGGGAHGAAQALGVAMVGRLVLRCAARRAPPL